MNGDVFTIRARRCLRCGRLLTSPQAVDDGYGCRCKMLANYEDAENEPLPGQITMDDYFKEVNNG